MKCVSCFFSNSYQREIKINAGANPRFENKLVHYKDNYIAEVNALVYPSQCTCGASTRHQNYLAWIDAFTDNIRTNTTYIENVFQRVFSIYKKFLRDGIKSSIDELWSFLEDYNLRYNSCNSFDLSQVFYRGRGSRGFDENDIFNLFHISFELRKKMDNQRFSITGQPMLYLGTSLLAVEKELNQSSTDLALAAYVPNQDFFSNRTIYDFKNSIDTTINKALPGIFDGGSIFTYDDTFLNPNHDTIHYDLAKSIFFQCCTFPVESRDVFIPEYVLPQMFTTALFEHDYDGVLFHSTKDYQGFSGYHRFSEFDCNLALFTNYNEINAYDEELLSHFECFTFDGTENFAYTTNDIQTRMRELIGINGGHNLSYHIAKELCELEYLVNSSFAGTPYYDSPAGKYEIELKSKFCDKISTMVV